MSFNLLTTSKQVSSQLRWAHSLRDIISAFISRASSLQTRFRRINIVHICQYFNLQILHCGYPHKFALNYEIMRLFGFNELLHNVSRLQRLPEIRHQIAYVTKKQLARLVVLRVHISVRLGLAQVGIFDRLE